MRFIQILQVQEKTYLYLAFCFMLGCSEVAQLDTMHGKNTQAEAEDKHSH